MIFGLLDVEEQIGLELTDSYMMDPAAAVCGFYYAHPQAKYFSVGKIDEEQLVDFAERNDEIRNTVHKWLESNYRA